MNKIITLRDSQSLESIINDVSKFPLLTVEQEVQLANRIKNGDEGAVQELYNCNLRFVVSVAKQYLNKGLSLEELIKAGNKGLGMAARKFDPTRGFKFIAYAVWFIRQCIIAEIERTTGVKPNTREHYKKEVEKGIYSLSLREADILRKSYGMGVTQQTLDEIGEEMNLTSERVRQIRERAIRKLRNNK